MGYQIGSVATIGRDDPHSYFLFYVESGFLEHQWINDYFQTEFSRVANLLGDKGVVVVSKRGSGVASEFERMMRSRIVRVADERQESILHMGLPLLIVTLYPMAVLAEKTQGAEANCVALNLATIRDERELGALIDSIVIASITSDELTLLDRINPIAQALDNGNWNRALDRADIFELKPNIMGMGINLNAVIEWLRERRRPGR